MFKKINRKNKKGFTLAELLIVVAIIGVLVAISIPIFTAQLEKARQSTDLANLRASYAEAATASLEADGGAATGSTVTINHSDTGFTKFTDAKVGEIPVATDSVLSASKKGDKIHAAISATGVASFVKE